MTPTAVILNAVIAYLFTDHLWHSYRLWRHYRDARGLRHVVTALIIASLAWSTLLRSALLAVFGLDANIVVVSMLWGIALVGGLFMWVSWRRDV